MSSSVSGSFIALCTQMLAHFQLHHLLGEQANSLPQELRVLQLCLAQEILQCHPELVGHRVSSID
jgi:hypothetical protein